MEAPKPIEEMNYFEILAWLGIGSSHPGGLPATIENLKTLDIKPEEYVLDAGCGNGLTACLLAKAVGCKVVGIDLNAQMIENARLRAQREGVADLVEFKVADVYSLPFEDNTFDLVIGESITVFLDKEKAYKEFLRVLKPEGRIADLEMCLFHELPDQLRNQMEYCFGKGTNPLLFDKWKSTMENAGFKDVEIKNPRSLTRSHNVKYIVRELRKDWLMLKDLPRKIKTQPGLINRLQQNANFTKRYHSYFGFGLICGRKPTPPPPPPKKTLKERLLIILTDTFSQTKFLSIYNKFSSSDKFSSSNATIKRDG